MAPDLQGSEVRPFCPFCPSAGKGGNNDAIAPEGSAGGLICVPAVQAFPVFQAHFRDLAPDLATRFPPTATQVLADKAIRRWWQRTLLALVRPLLLHLFDPLWPLLDLLLQRQDAFHLFFQHVIALSKFDTFFSCHTGTLPDGNVFGK